MVKMGENMVEGATVARALSRLNQALSALEDRLSTLAAPQEVEAKIAELEVRWRTHYTMLEEELMQLQKAQEALKEENRELSSLLQQSRASYAALQDIAQTVSLSLDRSIEEVEGILAGEAPL